MWQCHATGRFLFLRPQAEEVHHNERVGTAGDICFTSTLCVGASSSRSNSAGFISRSHVFGVTVYLHTPRMIEATRVISAPARVCDDVISNLAESWPLPLLILQPFTTFHVVPVRGIPWGSRGPNWKAMNAGSLMKINTTIFKRYTMRLKHCILKNHRSRSYIFILEFMPAGDNDRRQVNSVISSHSNRP